MKDSELRPRELGLRLVKLKVELRNLVDARRLGLIATEGILAEIRRLAVQQVRFPVEGPSDGPEED
jgi:hypothetical protein